MSIIIEDLISKTKFETNFVLSTTMNTDNLITTIYTEDVKGNETPNGKPIERPDGLIMIGTDNPTDGPD